MTSSENKKVKSSQPEVKNYSRARSESPRNKSPVSKELLDRTKTPCKQVGEPKKDKLNLTTRHEVPNKIPRLDRHRLESSENEKSLLKMRSTSKELKTKNVYRDNHGCEESRLGISGTQDKRSSRKAREETKLNVKMRSRSVSLGKGSDKWKKYNESEDNDETLEPDPSRDGISHHLKSARASNVIRLLLREQTG